MDVYWGYLAYLNYLVKKVENIKKNNSNFRFELLGAEWCCLLNTGSGEQKQVEGGGEPRSVLGPFVLRCW